MARPKRKIIEADGVYHASPRSFERNEKDLVDMIGQAIDDQSAEVHKRRLTKLRARQRAKVRIIPKDGENPILRKLPKKDPLSKLPDRYYRIGEMLRDHSEGVSIGSQGDLIGFVEGGRTQMTGPEAYANKSMRGKIAWERFLTAIIDEKSEEYALECSRVLIHRKSFTECLVSLSIAPNRKPSSRQIDNFVAVLAAASMRQGLI